MPLTKKEKEERGYWVHKVTTDSVAVPLGTMTKEPKEVARILLKHNKFPGSHGAINRFIQYHINRGGRGLKTETVAKLKKAQEIIRSKRPNTKSKG
jgi:hypothetical protein